MGIDLHLILRKILLETGKVSLPGFGTFTLDRTPANYAKNENKIFPPTAMLKFSNDIADQNYLSNYLSAYYKIKSKKAINAIDEFVGKLNDALLQDGGSIIIEHLGLFNNTNGNIEFIEDKNLSTWYTNSLLPIIPIPIQKIYSPIDTGQEITKKKEDESLLIRWLPFLLMLMVLTLSFKYYFSKAKHESKVATENVIFNSDLEIDYTQLNSDSLANPIDVVDTAECIIITGYFTKAKHVLKMADKIEDLGYQLFMEDVADGTRVGFKFDCSNTNLKEKIYDIRKKISKDAWYLVPEITIE